MVAAEKEGLAAACAAASVTRVEELGRAPLEHLRRAVGAASALLYRYDAEGALRPLAGDLASSMASYTPELWRSDPTQQVPHQLPSGPRVVLPNRMVDSFEFQACLAYQQFYRPHAIADLMCLWVTDSSHGAAGMTGIVLTRPEGTNRFDDAETRIAQQVLGVFSAAAQRDTVRRRLERAVRGATAAVSHLSPMPLAVVDEERRVLWASSRAAPYLERRAGRVRLPEAVDRGCSAALRGPAATSVAFSTPEGRRARADMMLHQDDDGTRFVMVGFGMTHSQLPREYGLTRAEWDVLDCVARGSSNRDIACELHVSIETVRTHVKRILSKLSVKSRVDAALWRNNLNV